MDADSFAAQIATALPFLPSFPGNAQPTVIIPDPITGEPQIAGADPDNSSWSSFLDKAKNLALTPVSWAHSAYDEVTQAPARATAFVEGAIKTTSEAVTGFVGWTKWLVVGLVAVAVIYGLMLVAPIAGFSRQK
jgi:hypothetical protein